MTTAGAQSRTATFTPAPLVQAQIDRLVRRYHPSLAISGVTITALRSERPLRQGGHQVAVVARVLSGLAAYFAGAQGFALLVGPGWDELQPGQQEALLDNVLSGLRAERNGKGRQKLSIVAPFAVFPEVADRHPAEDLP